LLNSFNIIPEESILKLIEGLTSIVPIISVEAGTYRITNSIGKSKIYADNTQKNRNINKHFEKFVDVDDLSTKLSALKRKE
jgi:phosphate acetyltransferase